MNYSLLLLLFVMLLEQCKAFEEEWQNHVLKFIYLIYLRNLVADLLMYVQGEHKMKFHSVKEYQNRKSNSKPYTIRSKRTTVRRKIKNYFTISQQVFYHGIDKLEI